MENKPSESRGGDLPVCATEFIRQVGRKMRCRRRAAEDVQAELTAHFEDELRACTNAQERERRAQQLIAEFGDAKLLAVLCRRAKKRCRPLWRRILVRTAQVLGALVLYSLVCSLPLFLGRPTVRVNYAEWLSERWQPAQAGLENAKRYYDRAAKLYIKPPETLEAKRKTPEWTVRDCNEADLRLLGGWLVENKPVFDLLRKGANTANYWPVYDIKEGDWSNASLLWMEVNVRPQAMETLTGYKTIARALGDWVAYRARLGAADEAIVDSLVILRLGRHLEGKGLLVDQLVGIAIEGLGKSTMFDALQKREASVDVLARVQDELASTFKEDQRIINFDGEKVFWYDSIQRTFTDDGQGGGHALRHGMPFAAGDWMSNLAGTLLFDYPDRREAITMVDAYFEQAEAALRTPPNENKLPPNNGENVRTPKLNPLLSIVVASHERLVQLARRAKTGEAALVTTVAILRYKAGKGSYPARLEELVQAGLLASLPDDPFGKGPLTYRKTADGFLLYSRGENLTDDGGRQGSSQNGKPRMWANNGDWVFWPVDP
jgi:hypothetical protein